MMTTPGGVDEACRSVATHGDVEEETDAQAHLAVSEGRGGQCRTEMELRHVMDGELEAEFQRLCGEEERGSALYNLGPHR
ncbi:unnamed protein product [Heligmosomoides polygyrus]|uniref:Uncharacterized protein n=1 Tax=Heligmosomoides polygyrus TaxID=6339 RepID=A0A183GED7_HELPZ|nr:unnamed protein product [Heligmosomoides polygyrus]